MIDTATFWTLTVLLGIGTFLVRFSFLGFFGRKQLPDWLVLHLKYVGVGVLPAMVTPLVLWPQATGGETEPARIIAALVTFLVALRLSVTGALVAGMGTLYLMQALL
ncbi:AzlD domain-containing protein [Salipiger sp. H15]|uniref:AzlD domain-containing protein n=1 Tax=Alloyangia sp. H15 TaxID=3029062 RepID=A0AAU8ADQ0_9RHOB